MSDTDLNAWWCISDEVLREMVERAHAGEDPDLLLVELYANCDDTIDGEGPVCDA